MRIGSSSTRPFWEAVTTGPGQTNGAEEEEEEEEEEERSRW